MADNAFRDNQQDPRNSGGEKFKEFLRGAFRLRSVALSFPVAVIAVILAVNNAAILPGPLLIGAGENVITISKPVLIMGPLTLTALSILMTLFSKKVTYPWIISSFTLLLPVVLWLTMSFGI